MVPRYFLSRQRSGQKELSDSAGLLQPPAEGIADVHERRRITHLPRRRIPDADLRRHDVHPQPQRRRRLLHRLEHKTRCLCYKTFSLSLMKGSNKLECFSLASFSAWPNICGKIQLPTQEDTACGLYNKHTTIVSDAYRAVSVRMMPNLEHLLR